MKRIYFMRPVGQLGPIKIGCSKLPSLRLDTYSRWSPHRLEIVCSAPGTHKDEAALHGLFRAHHLHHEWFGASKELLALVDYVAANGALPELPEVVPFARKAPASPCKRPKVFRSYGIRAERLPLIEAVGEAYGSGEAVADIAQRMGISHGQVRVALRQSGVAARRKGRPAGVGCKDLSVDPRALEFRARYEGGETLKAIGDSHGLTRERVRQVLRKMGAPSLGIREQHKQWAAPITEREAEIAAAYRTGNFSPSEMRSRYDLTSSQFQIICKRTGVPSFGAGYWNKLPDDERITKEVCELYCAGVSGTEIARKVEGVRYAETVYRYLAKGGVKPRGKSRHLTDEETATVVRHIEDGATIIEAAKVVPVSPAIVRRTLENLGKLPDRDELERRRRLRVEAANRRRTHVERAAA